MMPLISSTTVTDIDEDLDCNLSEQLAMISSVDAVRLPNLENWRLARISKSGQSNQEKGDPLCSYVSTFVTSHESHFTL